MKTTAITTTAPVKVTRLALYLAIVAAMAFFNCAFLKAATPEDQIKLENWMLDISTNNIAEQEISLEDWMTSNTEFLADTEVEIEDWMISSENEFIAQNEIAIEDWMVEINSADYYLFFCGREDISQYLVLR